MKHRRYFILFFLSLSCAFSCSEEQDSRFIAPVLRFESASYAIRSEEGGLDVSLQLNRPAEEAFTAQLNISSTLEEGFQYSVSSHSVAFAAGESEAVLHLSLVDDEIWVAEAHIDITVLPGVRYSVDPYDNSQTRVVISKYFEMPVLSFADPSEEIVTNPFLGETLHLTIRADQTVSKDLPYRLVFGDLVPGEDYLIDGKAVSEAVLPAGVTEAGFDLGIVKKDQCGFDRTIRLSLTTEKGKYIADAEAGSVEIRLCDPVVDLSKLWRTVALNGGTGYRWNQAIATPDGGWEGNSTVDMWVAAEGSNYVSSQRSIFTHPSFNCPATASPSHVLRLDELVPNLRYPSATTLIDYGQNDSYRSFQPCDSLFRFLPDSPDDLTKGSLVMPSPRVIFGYIGDYAAWGAEWKEDAKKTGGDMSLSTSSAILGKIFVTIERLEGRYDFFDMTQPIFLTVWLKSDDERLMQDVDFSKWDITEEDGLWKVKYKIWPR